MEHVLKSIVGIRGRDKLADLKAVTLLCVEHGLTDWNGMTEEMLWTIGIPVPPREDKRWPRLNRYIWDLVEATPGLLRILLKETNV